MLLIRDICHVNWTLKFKCILLYVSGGGASGGQIATTGISSETTRKALSNAYTHEKIIKKILP
jgi:hypothetical protein